MKLNLLPTTEKKSRQGKTAILVAALIVLGSIAGYGALTFIPLNALREAKSGVEDLQTQVANADATSKTADTIIASASDVIKNAQLAQAMIDHNEVYPKLYDDVKKYIPPYYRIQTISAAPISATTSQLTLTGTLSGYQRYADLMLALMRFKDAVDIQRQGYNLDDSQVPALTGADQYGKMRKANEGVIPDDSLERLAYFQAQAAAAPKGYLAAGSFGSGGTEVRGALPNASVVTIQMTVARDLRVPLAAATLSPAGGAATGFGGAPGAPGGFGPPGVPPGFGGPPGAPGGRGGQGD